jgi:hypothetical protein
VNKALVKEGRGGLFCFLEMKRLEEVSGQNRREEEEKEEGKREGEKRRVGAANGW